MLHFFFCAPYITSLHLLDPVSLYPETTLVATYNATTGLLLNTTNVTQYYDCRLKNSVDSIFGANGNYVASSVVGISILVVIVAYTRCCHFVYITLTSVLLWPLALLHTLPVSSFRQTHNGKIFVEQARKRRYESACKNTCIPKARKKSDFFYMIVRGKTSFLVVFGVEVLYDFFNFSIVSLCLFFLSWLLGSRPSCQRTLVSGYLSSFPSSPFYVNGDQGSLLCCDPCTSGKDDSDATPEKDEKDEEKGKLRMTVLNDEKEGVTYSYSFFHFMMMLGVLYAMMQLTNWSEYVTDIFGTALVSTFNIFFSCYMYKVPALLIQSASWTHGHQCGWRWPLCGSRMASSSGPLWHRWSSSVGILVMAVMTEQSHCVLA